MAAERNGLCVTSSDQSTEKDWYEAHLKSKLEQEKHRSWVENNLRMLHEGINTKL
jgi:hypothetical protein